MMVSIKAIPISKSIMAGAAVLAFVIALLPASANALEIDQRHGASAIIYGDGILVTADRTVHWPSVTR
jgi:hypothetical protein